MSTKTGRNDPCPCGSGKKYKQCCLLKKKGPRKLTAKWINAPMGPNLLERAYGDVIPPAGKTFEPVKEESKEINPTENKE